MKIISDFDNLSKWEEPTKPVELPKKLVPIIGCEFNVDSPEGAINQIIDYVVNHCVFSGVIDRGGA